jgi:hypothetical protein
MRHLMLTGLAVAIICATAGAASAMDTCSGEFSATPLQALPVPAVVGLDLSDSSPTNADLASGFMRGMSNAGAQVPAGGAPTVKLHLTWQVIGQGGSTGSPGGGANAGTGANALVPSTSSYGGWAGNSQTFLQGGIDRALPDLPRYDAFAPGQSANSGLLIFRAEARGPAGEPIYWIGSLQCTLTGGDNQTLAYQLGQLVGAALGQRRDRVSM